MNMNWFNTGVNLAISIQLGLENHPCSSRYNSCLIIYLILYLLHDLFDTTEAWTPKLVLL